MSCSRPTSTNRTTAAADKLPSVRTVLSKSSKIFHKLSTINLAASASKRRSSSGGSIPDYLPSKKTRNGVPRSADFLALRFVLLSHDNQILGHHHQS
ncbi:hypothetical protein PTTG_06023 [Puccinia triticina 1-1 BBBD Race 1]|uniref:Uncharacterized protein n=1 Tax=Puccinia triticina (isolate 1-1 / race 1 (BBBD)) TaxID=630390 RepID=A0A0C4EYW8_PUCT1|nr:hypothetical protein PTTG_06023 [Puccinia triticina 1-1 BBBD Race 1]